MFEFFAPFLVASLPHLIFRPATFLALLKGLFLSCALLDSIDEDFLHVPLSAKWASSKLLSQASEGAATSLQVQLRTSQQVLELTEGVGTLAESFREASKLSLQIADILYLVDTFDGAAKAIQDVSKDVRALALDAQGKALIIYYGMADHLSTHW